MTDPIGQYLYWQEHHKNAAHTTLIMYRSVLRTFERHMLPQTVCEAVRADLEGFVDRSRLNMTEQRTAAPRTRRKDVAILKGFYRWMLQEQLIDTDPTGNLAAPKVPSQQPNPVPLDTWFDTWSLELDPLIRTALGLGYYAGLRRGEIAALTGDMLSDGKINRFIRKGRGEHTVPWIEMLDTVRTHDPRHDTTHTEQFIVDLVHAARIAGPHKLLSPWSQSLVADTVNRKYHQHNIPFTPHQCRHSCATNMVDAGVPIHIVSELLNHTNIQTTMGYVKVASNGLSDWRKTQDINMGERA